MLPAGNNVPQSIQVDHRKGIKISEHQSRRSWNRSTVFMRNEVRKEK